MSRILFMSHCILNAYSQVRSERESEDKTELIRWLMEQKIGLVQLPCPETELYGLRRWGHCREQFDHPHYHAHASDLVDHTVQMLRTYLDVGHEIVGVIGIDGSPSCGINFTCSAPTWGGEISSIGDLDALLSRIGYIDRNGVYMEKLRQAFDAEGHDIPFYGYRRGMIPDLIERLRLRLRDLNELS